VKKMNVSALIGSLAILNCTTGDTRVTFDSNKPAEVERAKAIVEDMLKRGYIISVVVGDKMERAVGFDAEKGDYLVKDSTPADPDADPKPPVKKATKKVVRRNAKSHAAVAVGPTAGGGLGCSFFPACKTCDCGGMRQ